MKKLEKLSEDQEKLMIQTKNEWLNYIFSCKNKLNKKEVEKGINWMYKISNLEKPMIIYLDSPYGLQIGVNILDQILKSDLKQVGSQVGSQVRSQVWSQVGSQVWSQVGSQVWSQVGSQVGSQVESQVGSQDLKYYSFSYYGNIWDYGWISFYDFFQKINIFENENFNQFKSLLRSGVYDMIQLKGVCFVFGLPNIILRNNRNQLHNEKSHAIEFKDGYKCWFWKGISVPQKLIETPELITKDDLKNNQNTEIRRCYIEKLGVTKYFKILSQGNGLKLIDEDIDNQGYPMKLLEFDFEEEKIQVLEVTCPSTERIYNLYPPKQNSKNVWDAKASTFNNEKLTYRHGDVGLKNINKENKIIINET